MILNDFLKFNDACPVCNEPLTLYMQCNDNTLWAANKSGRNKHYHFKPYKLMNHPFTQHDSMTLYDHLDYVDLKFEGDHLEQRSKTWNLNFFMLCNRSGINVKGNYAFDINPYYGCYMRATPWMEFRITDNKEKKWELNVINPDHANLTNVDENFCFKVVNNDLEKVYMLNFDYEESKTKLWHYTATAAQRSDEYYEPKLFDKEMPLVSHRPDFKKKEKFIERMNNWILIS